VAFTAFFSHDNANDGIPLTPQQTLTFDHVITNAGNGYNPQNGFFTAPVSGFYTFSLVVMKANSDSHHSVNLSIVKQGVCVCVCVVMKANSDSHHSVNLSIVKQGVCACVCVCVYVYVWGGWV
jgi:hypothetical protein